MPKRKRRPNWPLRFIALALISFAVIYIGAIPWLQNFQNARDTGSTLRLFEAMQLRFAQTFFVAWVFFFGSAIGSFANVVVYRMPRGKNIASRDSACPWCQNRIKLRHNIPVFGWLMLRGRCFACRLPISSRYPIVELCFGLMFLLLYLVEITTGAANLPGIEPKSRVGIVNMVLDPQWDIIGIYLFHAFLICMLLTWSLIKFDEMKLPFKLIGFAFLITLLLPIFFPTLLPLDALELTRATQRDSQGIGNTVLTQLSGGLAGLLLSLLFGLVSGKGPALAPLLALIGAGLGWQGLIIVLFVYGILILIDRTLPGQQPNNECCNPTARNWFLLTAACLITVCTWRYLEYIPALPRFGELFGWLEATSK